MKEKIKVIIISLCIIVFFGLLYYEFEHQNELCKAEGYQEVRFLDEAFMGKGIKKGYIYCCEPVYINHLYNHSNCGGVKYE